MINIIEFDKNFIFSFSEEREKGSHPADDYFFILEDLSINLVIKLKWILWGFHFLNEISNNVIHLRQEEEFEKSIEKSINFNFNKHILYIEDIVINSINDVNNLIKNLNEEKIYSSNTLISMKLKLNLKEFLLISYIFYPSLDYCT